MKKEHDKNDSPVTIFTGAGGSGDSPIFITEGSLEIVGINEDFQPAVAVPAVSFTVNKTSTIGSVKIKPGSVASNSGAAWSIALTETGTHLDQRGLRVGDTPSATKKWRRVPPQTRNLCPGRGHINFVGFPGWNDPADQPFFDTLSLT